MATKVRAGSAGIWLVKISCDELPDMRKECGRPFPEP